MKLGTRELYQPIQSCHVICLGISNKSVAVPRQDSIHPCRAHVVLSGHCNILCTSLVCMYHLTLLKHNAIGHTNQMSYTYLNWSLTPFLQQMYMNTMCIAHQLIKKEKKDTPSHILNNKIHLQVKQINKQTNNYRTPECPAHVLPAQVAMICTCKSCCTPRGGGGWGVLDSL